MTERFTAHHVSVGAVPGTTLTVQLPESWETRTGDESPALVSIQPAADAGPFADNVMVAIEKLGEEVDLAQLQEAALTQSHSTVPDYLLLDDHPAPFGPLGGWFRASLMTAENSTSVSTRQLMTVHDGALLSLTLTTLPFRELRAAGLFDRIASGLDVQGGAR